MSNSTVLPTYVQSFIGRVTYPLARTYEVVSNGDCFFDSVRLILASAGVDMSIRDLRSLVAEPILTQNDPLTQKTIQNWLELYQDACKVDDQELLYEFRYLKGLEKAQMPLNSSQRDLLYQQMVQSHPPLYWGDQHAIRVIEENTGLRFLIISDHMDPGHPKITPSLCWYHSPHYKHKAYAILYQPGKHYMPVSLHQFTESHPLGQNPRRPHNFIFYWEELPVEFRTFIRQGYN